jgi:hypothetical protein
MHVVFVHQTYPAQLGHLARAFAERYGWTCTYMSKNASGRHGPVECIPYVLKGGATGQTHFCGRTFENGVWHAHAVYEALKARPDQAIWLFGRATAAAALGQQAEAEADLAAANKLDPKVESTVQDLFDFKPAAP